jgi:hypothetical protein
MADVLRAATAGYDLVVIDTPPLGVVSDPLPLMRQIDGVVIVAGMGRNRRDGARRLATTLRSVEAPLLGVIANRVKGSAGAGYGYGYGYRAESTGQARHALPPATNGRAGDGAPADDGAPTATAAAAAQPQAPADAPVDVPTLARGEPGGARTARWWGSRRQPGE